MKILITGFDPFGGQTINPAYEAVKLLPDMIEGAKIIKIEIPTVFGRDEEVVRAAVEKHHPDTILCVGQAGGRSGMTVEKIAVNLMEARIPDNDGNQPIDQTGKKRWKECIFCICSGKEYGGIHQESQYSGKSFLYGRYFCM